MFVNICPVCVDISQSISQLTMIYFELILILIDTCYNAPQVVLKKKNGSSNTIETKL